MSVKNNIIKYYIYYTLVFTTFFLPFIIFYFQENLSFSLSQITLILTLGPLIWIAFEIPSGYIADRLGRKNSLIISMLLQISSLSVLFFSFKFYQVMIYVTLYYISGAFASGADTALVYDSLIELKKVSGWERGGNPKPIKRSRCSY